MTLNHQHQLELLKDILSNHQTDCCGSVAECEQLERLVKSLMVNQHIHSSMKPLLENVYSYSQNGKNAGNLNQHIQSHQSQLSEWVADMNHFS
ncbi:putative Zn-dependent peptidase [Oikeobacillus pervagus]|uniref:Zn-dependent peptidase n=1 Tax=Oikeobacillus pervagus TaxID=1325931 RepID=A0AAJ1T223_9BACI|nr:YtzH-like family protein [Oikeobacillus pervagus]MDQ0215742.1 putative Zn-dependent peptidase [Oikeobacillus pervagus]